MITGLRLHTCSSPKRLSALQSLLLSISIDWTIKLWDGEQLHPGSSVSAGGSVRPLLEWMISTYDYVCDIQWSPTHPGMFAAVTANSKLYVYNLLQSTTAAVEVIPLSLPAAAAESASSAPTPASTKLCWNVNGKVLYVGNSLGIVTCVPLSDEVTAYNSQDDSRLVQVIHQLRK